MNRKIAATEFKAKCLRILEDVYSRRDVILITKRGKPYAKVSPVEPPKATSPFGRQKEAVAWEGDLISPIDVEWEAMK